MRHTTHVTFSMFFITGLYVIFPQLFDIVPYQFAFVIGIFSTLVPDIDHPHSYISRSYWGVFTPAILKTTHHRGWTHSLVGAVIFTVIFAVILFAFGSDPLYSIAFFMGYVAHLISDSFNPSGVMWLWPKEKKLKVALVRTGSDSEVVFQKISLLLFVGVLIYDSMRGGGVLVSRI